MMVSIFYFRLQVLCRKQGASRVFFLSQVSHPHTQAWVKYLPSDIVLEKVGDEFPLSSDCRPNRITSLLSKPAIRRSLSFAVRVIGEK